MNKKIVLIEIIALNVTLKLVKNPYTSPRIILIELCISNTFVNVGSQQRLVFVHFTILNVLAKRFQ